VVFISGCENDVNTHIISFTESTKHKLNIICQFYCQIIECIDNTTLIDDNLLTAVHSSYEIGIFSSSQY